MDVCMKCQIKSLNIFTWLLVACFFGFFFDHFKTRLTFEIRNDSFKNSLKIKG